jgi:hypothetical protein
VFLLFGVESGSRYVAQAGLELVCCLSLLTGVYHHAQQHLFFSRKKTGSKKEKNYSKKYRNWATQLELKGPDFSFAI